MDLIEVPYDILNIIYQMLDKYSKVSLHLSCKLFYNNYFNDKHLMIECKNEYESLLKTRKLVNRYITRNIFIEDTFLLHGYCEQCNKKGFLQELGEQNEFTNTFCICIDNCTFKCKICNMKSTSSSFDFICVSCIWIR